MNADGSGTQLLMNTVRPYYVYGAKWAPNGRFISYTAGAGGCNGIEVMDADATNSRPLAGYSRTEGVCAGSPAWAPDSKSIAFVFDHGMQPNGVYVVDRDGRNLRLIGAEGFEPVWSPDGRAIAFASSLADGKGFLNIVDTKGEDRRQADIGFTKGAPCWTSDSAHLIFVSDRGKFDTIYRLDADGRNLHALTTTYLGELFDPACQPTLPR
jgi:Tol biopolymer transport system component